MGDLDLDAVRDFKQLLAVLNLPPQLTKEQEEQLSSGWGTIMSPVEVFCLGWKTALSEARRALERKLAS